MLLYRQRHCQASALAGWGSSVLSLERLRWRLRTAAQEVRAWGCGRRIEVEQAGVSVLGSTLRPSHFGQQSAVRTPNSARFQAGLVRDRYLERHPEARRELKTTRRAGRESFRAAIWALSCSHHILDTGRDSKDQRLGQEVGTVRLNFLVGSRPAGSPS